MIKFTKRTFLKIIYPMALVYWAVVKPKTNRAKIILNHNDKILLVEQTFHTDWSLPGGGINRGELPIEAAKRELYEELGLTDIEIVFLDEMTGQIDFRQDQIFVFVGSLTLEQVDQIKPDGVEVGGFDWFALNNLPYLKPSNQAILELYANWQASS